MYRDDSCSSLGAHGKPRKSVPIINAVAGRHHVSSKFPTAQRDGGQLNSLLIMRRIGLGGDGRRARLHSPRRCSRCCHLFQKAAGHLLQKALLRYRE